MNFILDSPNSSAPVTSPPATSTPKPPASTEDPFKDADQIHVCIIYCIIYTSNEKKKLAAKQDKKIQQINTFCSSIGRMLSPSNIVVFNYAPSVVFHNLELHMHSI